jgi:hypothetical protein
VIASPPTSPQRLDALRGAPAGVPAARNATVRDATVRRLADALTNAGATWDAAQAELERYAAAARALGTPPDRALDALLAIVRSRAPRADGATLAPLLWRAVTACYTAPGGGGRGAAAAGCPARR